VVKSDAEVDGRRISKQDVLSLPQDPEVELGHATLDGRDILSQSSTFTSKLGIEVLRTKGGHFCK
jgi:hypothetical protein